MERIDALVNAKVDIIVIDTAHGHSQGVIQAVKKSKEKYPELPVIAGNVGSCKRSQTIGIFFIVDISNQGFGIKQTGTNTSLIGRVSSPGPPQCNHQYK